MFNTRALLIVAVLAATLSAVLGLAACGGDDGEDVDKVLQETFSGDKTVRSGDLGLSLRIETEGGQTGGPITLKISGPFQSQGDKALPKFDFDLTLAAAGQTFRAGAVSTGEAGFLKFQGQAYTVPANVFTQFKQGYERSQAQQEGSRENQSFASLGVNPRDWLKDAKDEGTEDVGGTETIHISGQVDLPKLLTDLNQILSRASRLGVQQAQQLPSQLTPQQRQAVEDAIEDVTFDVFTGKDDTTLRRMTVDVKFTVPESARQGAQGITGGDVRFDLTLGDLNQPQTVSAPASPKPFAELTSALRGALGGLGGLGGGAGGSGGGTATTPPPSGGTSPPAGGDENAQRYLQCLQEAGGDVAKAQKCADLLNSG